jgi:hypothetical protein
MIGRKAAVGMALLCALVFTAFSASSASAITGTTAFTCVAGSGAGFSDAHCTKAVAKEAKFVHVGFEGTTKFHGTNAKTDPTTEKAESAILKTTLLGVEIEITCEKVFSHGSLTNKVNADKEHVIHANEVTILYTGCKYNKPSICKVKGGKIEVTKVTATSEKEGDNIRFKPEVGETFVTIESEGFGCPATAKVNGTVRAQVSGATLTFSEAGTTADKSLSFAGAAAGLEGKVTLNRVEKTEESAPTGNALSATTVTT